MTPDLVVRSWLRDGWSGGGGIEALWGSGAAVVDYVAPQVARQGLRGEPPIGWTVAAADGSLTSCEHTEVSIPWYVRTVVS
jgi:hypothetical protein